MKDLLPSIVMHKTNVTKSENAEIVCFGKREKKSLPLLKKNFLRWRPLKNLIVSAKCKMLQHTPSPTAK